MPGRIAVGVVWARNRRPLRVPLGALVLEHERVTLLDQEHTAQFDAALSELVVSRDGKWRVRLEAHHGTVYVSGLAVQEARRETTREFLERHDAVLVAPRPASISEKQWRGTLTSRHWASVPTDVRSQKVVWQATLIALLDVAGATVAPVDRAEGAA